jgi:hypothetical protein
MASYLGPKVSGGDTQIVVGAERSVHGSTWQFVVVVSREAWIGYLGRITPGHRIHEARRAYGLHKGFWNNIAEAFADSLEDDILAGEANYVRNTTITDLEVLWSLHCMYRSAAGITWINIY